MVVDEADDPDLLVLADRAAQEERALDIDVPQLVRATPLVRRPAFPADRGTGRAEPGQEGVDRVVVERVDLAPRELGRQALRVPVGQQAHNDDRLLDPGRQARRVRAAGSIDERLEATGRVAGSPAVEARPADPKGDGRGDALIAGDPDTADPEADVGQTTPRVRPRRPAATGREEQEARPFLIGVAEETTVRLGAVPDRRLVHAATLGRARLPCLTNPGNYT